MQNQTHIHQEMEHQSNRDLLLDTIQELDRVVDKQAAAIIDYQDTQKRVRQIATHLNHAKDERDREAWIQQLVNLSKGW